jgi:hypothetical protein
MAIKKATSNVSESKKPSTWTIFRVYFLIASLVGLIGMLVSLGIALTSIAQRVIITDNEYIKGQRAYELQQCKEPYYYGKTDVANQNWKPTQQQIQTCETEKTEQVLLGRRVDFKMSVLGGGIRALLFAALFFTHYPRFKKENNA